MKESISYENFKEILNKNDKHILGYIADVDRNLKKSHIYYACDNSDIFLETLNSDIDPMLYGDNHVTSKSEIYLFDSEESFLKSLGTKDSGEINNPFFKYRKIMKEPTLFKEVFLKELFLSLKLEMPEKLLGINLDKFNRALFDFGYDKACKFLQIHLIIFCGEYLNEIESNKGKWTVYTDSHFPLLNIPEFILPDGTSTRFSINHFLIKDLRNAFNKNKGNKIYIYNIENALSFNADWQKFKSRHQLKDK
jgi:hypothetical protein